MILNYVVIVFIIIFLSDESYGKRINIDGVYYECKSPKILLKEQEALEIEYVFLVVRIKILLIKEIKIKILI